MNLAYKQKGLSSIGWLFVAVTCYLYIIILVKVVPIYLDDAGVKKALDGLSSLEKGNEATPAIVIEALQKKFDVQNIRDIDISREGVVDVKNENGKTIVTLQYEKSSSIIKSKGMLQNLDVVVRFKHTKELK